ncbi:hypothetical protein CINS5906_02550 [Campylobacter insulaenigrae]|uniref:hypothetical protein n=1 Tax=Campylobacter insulaenigrae TaxID=260714 RepID=UPI0021522FEB|nr:hypothetical protein [Campylobacter insulaenigrae]MCR6584444.1 hypothetical protein [Campylobacter insulaenigrae]
MKNTLSELVENWNFNVLELQLRKGKHNDASLYINFLFNIGKLSKAYKKFYQHDIFKKEYEIKNDFSFLDSNKWTNANTSIQQIDFNTIRNIMYLFNKLKKTKKLSAEWICNSFNEYITFGDKILKAYYISSALDYFFMNREILCDFISIKLEKKIKFLHELYYHNTNGSRRYLNLFISECGNVRNNTDVYIRKPKIAVGFIGMLRGDWKSNLTNLIKDISNKYNADYFVASWNTISHFPGMNTGVQDWTRRLLSSEFNKKFQAPKEIADKLLFGKYFPKVYKELSYAYEEQGIGKQKLSKKIFNISNKIKNILLESQTYLSLHLVAGEYSYYLSNKVFKLIEDYEDNNKLIYDYVFLIRIDSQINDLGLEKIHLNELDNNTLVELHGKGGSMIVAKRNVAKIYANILKNYSLLKDYCTIENPHQTVPYYLSVNGIKRTEIPCIRISNTYALNGIMFPNIMKYLEQDLNTLNNIFSREKLNDIKIFFNNIYNCYSSNCSLLTKKYIVPYIGSLDDDKRKNRKKNFASEYIKFELPFRIGNAIINTYQTNRCKLLFAPYIVHKIIKIYQVDMKDYTLQSEYCYSLKLLPIELCEDYQESIKLRKSFVYRLGKIVLMAQQSRFKLGYIRLWFDIKNLKKEFRKQ